jgi:hypothetical protein
MNKYEFDIIIVGAGPAGLSAAADLSKNHSVLIIERKKPGATSATWYSYKDRIKEHDLMDCVTFESDHLHFVAPTFQHDMKDDCVVLDHNKVMQKWLNEAVKNGATVVQENFVDYNWNSSQKVIIQTDKNEYHGKLIIDAMGGQSPIIAKNKLVKRKDAWIIYGARIKLPQKAKRPTRIEYYPLGDKENTYVGVHPFNDTDINFYLFKGENNTFGNPSKLKDKFEKTLKEVHPDAEIVEPLVGSIISGILKKYALDNIIFWGSSGMLSPDGCGMGFNEIIRQKNTFVAEVNRAFNSNRLDRHSLNRIARSLRDIETMHFQRIIGAFSLYFNKSNGKWDGGVKWLNAMGDDSRQWMRNEMSLAWIRKATIKLHKAVPFRESVMMIPPNELLFIFEQLIRFTFSTTIFNIKKIFKIGGIK